MNLIQLIAERMRALRVSHHLTQEECAEMIGMAFKFYQQVESGRKKQIMLKTVERLAAVFGLEACDLIGRELPKQTVLKKKPLPTSSHYERRRGPYKSRGK